MKITELIDRCHSLLFDDATRWPREEMMEWYNDAVRAVIARRPDAGAVLKTLIHVDSTEDLTGKPDVLPLLVDGTRQELPGDGAFFMRLNRNVLDGSPSALTITELDRQTLDRMKPYWTSDRDDEAKHYVFEPVDPNVFHVYPGANINSRYEIMYSQVPEAVKFSAITDWATDETQIGVVAMYANAIEDFILFRAYSKSTDGQDLNRAAMHRDMFMQSIGAKSTADANLAQGAG